MAKPPKNDAEWARDVDRRLSTRENPSAQRVGDWVLSTDSDSGSLIGSHVDGGSRVIARRPEPSDDVDAVQEQATSRIRIDRRTNQTCNRGDDTLIQYEAIAAQSPDWSFTPPATVLTIPSDGFYSLASSVQFGTPQDLYRYTTIQIDGTPVVGDIMIYSSTLVHYVDLVAGQTLSVNVWAGGSGTFVLGQHPNYPTAWTCLAVTRLGGLSGTRGE